MFIKVHSKKTNKTVILNAGLVIMACIKRNTTQIHANDGGEPAYFEINESVEKVKMLLDEAFGETSNKLLQLHEKDSNRTIIINKDFVECVITDNKNITLVECKYLKSELSVVESPDKIFEMLTNKKTVESSEKDRNILMDERQSKAESSTK